jgi:hypothetical protein
MTGTEQLSNVEQLLVMAAAIRGLDSETNLRYANGGTIVGQVLEWLGFLEGEVRKSWEDLEYCPEITAVYGALVRLSHQILREGPGRPPIVGGEPIFEGSGNLGTPEEPGAFPHFNSFRLTPYGEELARELLLLHPQYQEKSPRGRFSTR